MNKQNNVKKQTIFSCTSVGINSFAAAHEKGNLRYGIHIFQINRICLIAYFHPSWWLVDVFGYPSVRSKRPNFGGFPNRDSKRIRIHTAILYPMSILMSGRRLIISPLLHRVDRGVTLLSHLFLLGKKKREEAGADLFSVMAHVLSRSIASFHRQLSDTAELIGSRLVSRVFQPHKSQLSFGSCFNEIALG